MKLRPTCQYGDQLGQLPDQTVRARAPAGPVRRRPGEHADHDNERVPVSMTIDAHTSLYKKRSTLGELGDALG